MSHEDAVVKLPKNFKLIASYKRPKTYNNRKYKKKIYGVQFHPEVTHTFNGKELFKNFLFSNLQNKKKWNVKSQKERLIEEIKKYRQKR